MSSKSRTVEHGGVDWKVIPGSRREQLLERMIRQDNMLHHAVPEIETLDGGSWLFPLVVGVTSGFCIGILVGWGFV